MNKKMKWFLLNAAFLVILCMGTIGGVKGAENVAVLFVWINFTICLFLFSEDVVKRLVEAGAPSVPAWLSFSYDILCAMLMAWYGWDWTVIAHVIHMILQGRIYAYKVQKDKSKSDAMDLKFAQDNPDIR